MTVTEAVELFRDWGDDRHAPYLWSDAVIFRYLSLAQQDAATRARLLREDAVHEAARRADDDDSALICSIDLVAAQARYALSPKIVALADGPRVVTIGDRALTRGQGPAFYPARSGQPEVYWDADDELIVYPTPTTSDLAEPVALDVFRVPLVDITDDTSAFELKPATHVGVVCGALALAFGQYDADTYDPAVAARWSAEFTSWFGARIDANVARKQRDKRPRVVRCTW